ncbi:JUNB (predicted) [Pycnogonum litorale]
MVSQQMDKFEIKRIKNREAATKCRKKKLERLEKLKKQVECMKIENKQLNMDFATLVDQVSKLKDEIDNHERNGCHISVLSSSAYFCNEGIKVEQRDTGVADDCMIDFPGQCLHSSSSIVDIFPSYVEGQLF